MIDFKKCCDCGLEKPIEKFTITKRGKYKEYRLNFCNPCAYIRRKKSDNTSNYYYARNPEAWNAYQREWAKRKRLEKKLKN